MHTLHTILFSIFIANIKFQYFLFVQTGIGVCVAILWKNKCPITQRISRKGKPIENFFHVILLYFLQQFPSWIVDDLTLLTFPLFWANKVKCLRYSDDILFGFELILFLSFRLIHTRTLQPPSQIIDVVVCKNSKLEHQHFLFKCPFVTLSMEKEVVKIWMNCVPASLKHAGNGSAKFNPNKKRTK